MTRNHLYNDLKPWICLDIECQCTSEPFASDEQWVEHLKAEDQIGRIVSAAGCVLCGIQLNDTEDTIVKHLIDHLKEISLLALPANIDYKQSSSFGRASNKNPDVIDTASNSSSKPLGSKGLKRKAARISSKDESNSIGDSSQSKSKGTIPSIRSADSSLAWQCCSCGFAGMSCNSALGCNNRYCGHLRCLGCYTFARG